MNQSASPTDVFFRLLNGVTARQWQALPELYAPETNVLHPMDPMRQPPLRSRDDVRAHFAAASTFAGPVVTMQAQNEVIHQTIDPEVIVAEFEYLVTVVATGATFTTPCIFVLRVRDGMIVESRDYVDHASFSRGIGEP